VKYLLDTDTLDHFQRSNPKVLQRLTAIGVENVAISVVTRIEVLQARFEYLRKAATAAELKTAQFWLAESDRLLAVWQIISVDDAACQHFDRLRADRSLRKIGRADLLIACIALAQRATVVTRNVRDFALVPGLDVQNWVD
jgi:tRNA(fMet)-specific endonuclease VapC